MTVFPFHPEDADASGSESADVHLDIKARMEYDKDKVDDMALALLYLGMFKDRSIWRAWKGFDWNILDRLHEKGYISNPKSAAKSVVVEESGFKRAEELFQQYFAMKTPDDN